MPSTNRQRAKSPLDHAPEAVTYAREQAGLTRTELAARCDVSLSLISEIEGGTRNATPEMIKKLAAALNCPRVVLERKHDEPETSSSTPGPLQHLRDGKRADTAHVQGVRGAAVAASQTTGGS